MNQRQYDKLVNVYQHAYTQAVILQRRCEQHHGDYLDFMEEHDLLAATLAQNLRAKDHAEMSRWLSVMRSLEG